MSRLAVALIALLLAVAAAGCTASSSSSGDFQGTERDVAAAIDDFSSAASRKNEAKICDELLTKDRVDAIIGPASSKVALALMDKIVDEKVVTCSFWPAPL